ncbi:MAG: DUF2721 domain-containing protein [Trichlorobacter sp.]|jgi:hypothetical protein
MLPVSDIHSVAHAIQLAVAPVFLLTGIGAMLSVMTNRLGRVIDRARFLEQKLKIVQGSDGEDIRSHLKTLAYRARLIGRAINLCTTTALLVCTVIALLFIGAFLGVDPSIPVALLFIAAMAALVAGLLWFLREIFVATSSLHIGPDNPA